ncbi:MAG: type II secretion system secretin GspD [Kiritimatiellae bacterium]|nr:type II secretion system secretin GspD [Kiritimatiellia bacterium]
MNRKLAGLLIAVFGAMAGIVRAQEQAAPESAAPAESRFVEVFKVGQADIRVLARTVGELTGRRFEISDKVEGRISLLNPQPVRMDELYPLFLALIEARGFTVIEREGISFIVPVAEAASGAAVAPFDTPGAGGWQTRLFKLEHTDAVEFARSIEPLVRSREGKSGVSVFSSSNIVLVTDTESSLRRIEAVLREVDQPGAAHAIEVVPLTHASAVELAEEVSTVLAGAESAGSAVSRRMRQVAEGGSAQPSVSMVVASPQSNSLVLVGTPVQRQEMKRVIELLDVESTAGQGNLHAVFLRFLKAEDVVKELEPILGAKGEKAPPPEISISANKENNAILVRAIPREVQRVRELVQQLDLMPQQVMVEVLIAEVAFDKKLDLGVEWSTVDMPEPGENQVMARSRPGITDTMLDTIAKGMFPQGLSVGIARGTSSGMPNLMAMIQALQENRDVKILSSVPLWAQNNVKASIKVLDEIPMLESNVIRAKTTEQYTDDYIQNIKRQEVGISLEVIPRVTADGNVTLELKPTIESVVSEGSADLPYTPTIARRQVETTVTVPDRTTVVISGLIREDRVKRVWKIPLLGDIPYLGALFRYTSDSTQRNNLMIFVTPRIIHGVEDSDEVRGILEPRADLPEHVTPGGTLLAPAPNGAEGTVEPSADSVPTED